VLRRTFIHVPGIGKTTERALWKQGCADWDSFLNGRFSTGQAHRGEVRAFIEQSRDALDRREHQFFSRHLGARESWRAYREFKDSCAFLDIETDGREVTVVGIYDGAEFTCLTKGENLENFRDVISRYSMLVTFCGAGFDLPMLEKRFHGVDLDQIHIDLHPILRKLGFRGGLKRIERELGILRPEDVAGLNGLDAVVLWRRYWGVGDEKSLERLIAYNREDCVNLERLADLAFERMEAATLNPPSPRVAQALD
jgi:uncharacterized protein YprB with RNaseH-like and TPR domain